MAGQLVLASASPRRLDLLEQLGLTVKAMPANIREEQLPDETPEAFVKRIAREKVLAVVDRIRQTLYPQYGIEGMMESEEGAVESPVRWVLGADTEVVMDGRIFGKPADHAEAIEMLLALQGREHVVLTGFCLYDMKRNKEGIQAVRTLVRMKQMTRQEVERYVGLGESMDKAGAYAVQGVGAYMVASIKGSYTNVVGLPLCQVVEMMEEMGASELLPYL